MEKGLTSGHGDKEKGQKVNLLVVFQLKQKLTRALGQNPELFLGSEFYEPRLLATFSVPLNLMCYVTLGLEGTSVDSSFIYSHLICLMPISSVLRLPTKSHSGSINSLHSKKKRSL